MVDVSAITTRFQGRVILRGTGVQSVISTANGSALKYNGRASNPEAYFSIENLKFAGTPANSSIGIELNICRLCSAAWCRE